MVEILPFKMMKILLLKNDDICYRVVFVGPEKEN